MGAMPEETHLPVGRADRASAAARLLRAKRQFAGVIREMLARLDEADDDLHVGCLFAVSQQAAKPAATLGFSGPPVEHVVIHRGQPDPVLDANPSYTHVLRIRVNDPAGLTYRDILLGANKEAGKATEPLPTDLLASESKAGGRPEITRMLRRWERAVDGLDVRDVRYSRPHMDRRVDSLEGLLFSMQLLRELRGIDSIEVELAAEETSWDEFRAQFDPQTVERLFSESSQGFLSKHEFVSILELPDNGSGLAIGTDSGPRTQERQPSKSARGITSHEANVKARELLDSDADFRDKGQREWAKAIGCSVGLVANLPAWRAIMEETGRSRKTAANASERPKAVSLTRTVLAMTGENQDPSEIVATDEIMRRLMEVALPKERARLHNLTLEQRREMANAYEAQQRDIEPSPLDKDGGDRPPQRVKIHKRL